MDNLNTGSDLKSWRIANHLTQKKLADKISYSASRLSHIEYGNEPLTRKLIQQIEELNVSLHPPIKKNPIAEKWDSINYYSNQFEDEMSVIEKGILSLLTIDVNKLGIEKTEAYLKFLGSALINLTKVNSINFDDTKKGKQPAIDLFNEIYREAVIYLRKIHTK